MSTDLLNSYDFIVVGAGAAGCYVASRLARTKKQPTVLIIEAGGKNSKFTDRIDGEKWLHRADPSKSWGYATVPQRNVNNRVIPYDRGKGLGGSTAINYSCWSLPPKDDHNKIASMVDDPEWNWENAQKRYKRMESYHGDPTDIPNGYHKYLCPNPNDHGRDGPLKVGFPIKWERSLKSILDIWTGNGVPINQDHNSGNPIGIAVAVSTAYKGIRTTAADVLLTRRPPTLHILTDTQVARVIFKGRKAVGVATIGKKQFFAKKEVIISTGSLDTPRVLMHSGIGPTNQLRDFNIPILQANKNVGQHLQDHAHIFISFNRAEHTSDRSAYYRSKERQAAARVQWEKDQTGPLAEYGCSTAMSFLKAPRPTVPSYEIFIGGANPADLLDPANSVTGLTIAVILMNLQSQGSVTLQSSDPAVPLVFDPKIFSHPYDRRVAIEALREVLKLTKSRAFQKDTVSATFVPKSESEQDLLVFWKENLVSTWHMSTTARMGKSEEEAVVDRDLRVFGVQGLRVADQSVFPFLPNCHTQSTAYLVGLTLGDKIVAEYGLDR